MGERLAIQAAKQGLKSAINVPDAFFDRNFGLAPFWPWLLINIRKKQIFGWLNVDLASKAK
jgi:hypothetical protein